MGELNWLQRKVFRKKQNKTSAQYNAISPLTAKDDDEFGNNPILNPSLFQGDMFLTESQLDKVIDDTIKKKMELPYLGSIVASMYYKWVFPIKYYLSPVFPATIVTTINTALAAIQANTCIRSARQYSPIVGFPGINVIKGNGCWCYVGQIYANAPQDLSIGEGCQYNGIIQHEFTHALGIQHEQSRPDRDTYVNIYPANMQAGAEAQYTKSSVSSVKDFGVGFDMGSDMLYFSTAFSANGQKTMAPKNAIYDQVFGQRAQLSFCDYKILNYNYCNATCATKITCYNGGIQNPNSCTQCMCPNGFTDTYCYVLKKGTGAYCGATELYANTTVQSLFRSGPYNCYLRIKTDAGYKIKMNLQYVNLNYGTPCPVGNGLQGLLSAAILM
uniref:Metalloendopeptidase n=1 Tax=Rhabditophanes sp. KR3021 TaxID=114890 RepID=A0AC35TRA8_9BILA